VEVRARIDVVSDAGGDEREDCRGALTAELVSDEEPVLGQRHLGRERRRDLQSRHLMPPAQHRPRAVLRRGDAGAGPTGGGHLNRQAPSPYAPVDLCTNHTLVRPSAMIEFVASCRADVNLTKNVDPLTKLPAHLRDPLGAHW
jgi:hypothetical protein